ncbi:hypothetical protein PFISCL1PPCAC_1472 [Pristionchus fissidentatus]|uniref:SRCR domain-containing protein n=1 Tax=Pristionchus fissidentatus TaxID=1538716 RepID=A0AAV5USP0_9BILA|nr:hypothetical protein PFISCL1PPCAC_1472 [Pristionchus fissidentatus]
MKRILLLTLACTAALAAAQHGGNHQPKCGVGAAFDSCPNACNEPKCGDDEMEFCASLTSCDPPRCKCQREQGYALNPSTGKCVKRAKCPTWTTNPCMTVKCSAGHSCKVEFGRGRCVKDDNGVPLNPCAVTLCQVGTICEQSNGQARCVAPPNSGNNNCTIQFEEWKQCGTCERTCENKTPFCNRMCQPGRCMCQQGFFRSKEGKCVTENDCDIAAQTPPTPTSDADCKKNEYFTTCSSMCEAKCGQYAPMACILMCGPPACQCKEGFYRNSNGECMSRADCDKNPPKCKKNQVFSQCSTMCAAKCGEYGVKPCMAMCGPPKCECAPGFYLNGKGDCLSKAECEVEPHTPGQADCKPNEIFRECPTQCEEKCNEKLTRACPASCGPVPKCQCDTGFFRNRVGDCVNQFDCDNEQEITCANIDCVSGMTCEMKEGKPTCVALPALTCNTVKCAGGHTCEIVNGAPVCTPQPEVLPRISCANVRCAGPCTDTPNGPRCGPRPVNGCPPNEEIRNCTNKCNEPFCGDENFARRCALVCLTPECECIQGFVRDKARGCVKREECAKEGQQDDEPTAVSCGSNEEYRECANKCFEPFCGDEGMMRNCFTVCQKGACECKKGFVRERTTKQCIKREQCPPTAMTSCAKRNCGIAMRCVMERNRTQCVPLFPAQKVATATSYDATSDVAAAPPPSAAADAASRSARSFPTTPDSCDKVTCAGGGTCYMEEVKCVSGPCKPAVPKCRGGSDTSAAAPSAEETGPPVSGYGSVYQPFADNCDQLKCKHGETCDMETIRCFAAPCKKQAVCRPSHNVCTKENEVYRSCFTGCEPTCQHRDMICSALCKLEGGCACDSMYIRNEHTNECVKLADCPNTRDIPIEKPHILEISSAKSFASFSPSMAAIPPMAPVPPPNDCDSANCPVGTICIMQTVQCFVPPCYPVPECQKDPNYLPGDEIVPSCEGHKCATGEKCELQEVQCIRAPCYPIPNCVPDTNSVPACTMPCPYGMSCVMETVYCKKAPCPQRPTCKVVPADPTHTCKRDNEVWSQCFTGCESTCQERNKACTLQCGPGGCACETGYIRDKQTGDCVRERHCPRLYDGPKNCDGVFCRGDMECKMRRGVPVCMKRAVTGGPMGTMPPSVTCDTLGCQPGEKCVQKSYGPQCEAVQCGANEQYDVCFAGCEGKCNNRENTICPAICGPGGCKCKNGYFRNDNDECVTPFACPSNPSCGPNQIYDRCHHGCEASCNDRNPSCTEQCGPGGCKCSAGFVRNANLDCIKESTCPRRNYG